MLFKLQVKVNNGSIEFDTIDGAFMALKRPEIVETTFQLPT